MAERDCLSALWIGELADRREAQDDAVPMPRERVRKAVQRKNWNGHGEVEARLPGVDGRHLPVGNEPEIGVEHEALHRDLNIDQRSAWFLAHRLRVALAEKGGVFAGPVEVDETYFGGKRKNTSNAKRKELAGTGRGAVGKTAVIGEKDRGTNQVAAKVIERTDAPTLQGFVGDHAAPGAAVYSDDASAYEGMPFDHETVTHSLSEYVRGDIHINGIESLWSMLKRAHTGTFHKLSLKHLDRYVQEFAARHNLRDEDTIDIISAVASGMDGKRLRYRELISDNGLESGART